MSKIIKVVEQLAHGGFGKVEKVQYGKATAVRKTFDPTIDVLRETTMEKLLKRFRREVSVQSSLSEEYFIPILESDLSGADPWFVMPVADCTYTEKIKQDRGKERFLARQGLSATGLADCFRLPGALVSGRARAGHRPHVHPEPGYERGGDFRNSSPMWGAICPAHAEWAFCPRANGQGVAGSISLRHIGLGANKSAPFHLVVAVSALYLPHAHLG